MGARPLRGPTPIDPARARYLGPVDVCARPFVCASRPRMPNAVLLRADDLSARVAERYARLGDAASRCEEAVRSGSGTTCRASWIAMAAGVDRYMAFNRGRHAGLCGRDCGRGAKRGPRRPDGVGGRHRRTTISSSIAWPRLTAAGRSRTPGRLPRGATRAGTVPASLLRARHPSPRLTAARPARRRHRQHRRRGLVSSGETGAQMRRS